MASPIADLLVRIGADTAELRKGLQQSATQLEQFRTKAVAAFKSLAIPAATVAALTMVPEKLAAIGKQAIETAGALYDQAKALNVSAEFLQEQRLVAEAAGVSAEQYDKALMILTRTVGQAAIGQGTFEKTLDSVGIKLRDSEGHVKSVQAVYAELGAKIRDGSLSQAQAVATAAAAFGREGGKMVEVLRQTAAEQQKVIDTARQYGAILSNEVVAAADAYGDELALIEKGTAALQTQSELVLAPLTLKWASLKNEIAGAVAELARASGLIDDNATLQQRRMQQLEAQIRATLRAKALSNDPISAADDPFVQQQIKDWRKLRALIDETKAATAAAAPAVVPGADGGGTDVESDEDRRKRLARMFPELDLDAIRALRTEVLQTLPDFQAQVLEEISTGGAQQIEVMRNLQQELEAGEIKHQGLLTEAHRQGVEARNQFERQSSGMRVKTVLGDLAQMTAGVATHSKRMFEINKVAALGSAVINTAEGVTKALSAYPPPLSFVMAAAQAAAGLAQINAIRSTQFQGGGTGTTPSAAGSTPTVNGTPVQQGAAGGGSQARLIRIVGEGDKFSRSAVRDLIEQINEAIGDGAKLVLA